MQAFRQCLLCSKEGQLLSRTDFRKLRSNMAAFRKGCFCVSVFRNVVCALSTNRFVRHRLMRLPTVTRANCISMGISGGLCAIPFSQQAENLSHEALVRRASSLVTDSVSTYLSQTTLALVDSFTHYTRALHTLIALHKRHLSLLGKITPAEEDSIWQVIIGQRVEVSDRLDECKRFESSWMNAVNLSELAAETAHNAGAQQASVTVQTNLRVAQSQVQQARQLSSEAERKLAETKAEEIQRIAEFAVALEKNIEDVPEAYLRED